jgi:glucose-1-phosphate thymidylyltransferase
LWQPEILLEANRVLLSEPETSSSVVVTDAVVIPPIDLGNDINIEESIIGSYVSIDDSASIPESIVRDGIVGRNATPETVNLEDSIVGDGLEIQYELNHLNLGDNSIIEL